jgi:hypothetical protein
MQPYSEKIARWGKVEPSLLSGGGVVRRVFGLDKARMNQAAFSDRWRIASLLVAQGWKESSRPVWAACGTTRQEERKPPPRGG